MMIPCLSHRHLSRYDDNFTFLLILEWTHCASTNNQINIQCSAPFVGVLSYLLLSFFFIFLFLFLFLLALRCWLVGVGTTYLSKHAYHSSFAWLIIQSDDALPNANSDRGMSHMIILQITWRIQIGYWMEMAIVVTIIVGYRLVPEFLTGLHLIVVQRRRVMSASPS